MDRERAKELLPIIQAFADGEDIQFRMAGCIDDPDWNDLPPPEMCLTFPAEDYEYRIKPDPREFWINTALDTITTGRPPLADNRQHWIKVREVI